MMSDGTGCLVKTANLTTVERPQVEFAGIPSKLMVSAGGLPVAQGAIGQYQLAHDLTMNGLPVWIQRGGVCRIFMNSEQRWVIGVPAASSDSKRWTEYFVMQSPELKDSSVLMPNKIKAKSWEIFMNEE